MIRLSKNLNVAQAVEAKTANAMRIDKADIDFDRASLECRMSFGSLSGGVFVSQATRRISVTLSSEQAESLRSAVETAAKKAFTETLGISESSATVI